MLPLHACAPLLPHPQSPQRLHQLPDLLHPFRGLLASKVRRDGIHGKRALDGAEHFTDGGGLLGQFLGPGKKRGGKCRRQGIVFDVQLRLLAFCPFTCTWRLVFRAQPADVALGLFGGALCVEGYKAGEDLVCVLGSARTDNEIRPAIGLGAASSSSCNWRRMPTSPCS